MKGSTASLKSSMDSKNRLMAVHGWVEGKDFPPSPQDFQALMLYGLIYLASSQRLPLARAGYAGLAASRVQALLLQASESMSLGTWIQRRPTTIKKLIDKSMDAMRTCPLATSTLRQGKRSF